MIAPAQVRPRDDARQRNEALLAADLRERRPRPDSYPAMVRLETTSGCSLGCRHCFKGYDIGPGRVMPMDLYDQIADELFSRIRWVALAFDGEPLQDPFLDERLRRFDGGGPKIDLLTSGDGLEDWLDRLVPALGRLTISLETLREKPFRFIRPGLDLRTLLRALERFDRLRAEYGGTAWCRLGFRVTVFEGNHEWLCELVRRLAASGADEVRFVHGVAVRGGEPDLAPTGCSDRLAVALHRAAAQAGIEGIRAYYPSLRPAGARDPASESLFNADGWLAAHAPWTQATIDVDGAVSLCCPRRRLSSVPSVLMDRAKGFHDAWTAVPFQVLRKDQGRVSCCAFCPGATEAADG